MSKEKKKLLIVFYQSQTRFNVVKALYIWPDCIANCSWINNIAREHLRGRLWCKIDSAGAITDWCVYYWTTCINQLAMSGSILIHIFGKPH